MRVVLNDEKTNMLVGGVTKFEDANKKLSDEPIIVFDEGR